MGCIFTHTRAFFQVPAPVSSAVFFHKVRVRQLNIGSVLAQMAFPLEHTFC